VAYADLGPGRIEVEFTRAGADFDEDVDDEIEEDEER
jgi:hypothetical protein